MPIPNTPSLAALQDGLTSILVELEGDAGATHTLCYMQGGDDDWTDGGSRSGDGVLAVTGLTNGATYILSAYSTADGLNSLFAPVGLVTLVATPAADGFMMTPIELLRATLAGSATWRTWCGATTGTAPENLAAALARCYRFGVTPTAYPFATVGVTSDTAATLAGVGFSNQLRPRSGLKLTFDAQIAEADLDDDDAALTDFMQHIQAILDEMGLLAGTPGYLDITGWKLDGEPRICREDSRTTDLNEEGADERLAVIQLEILVEWGKYGG